ncbi:unnamed protein product, partial [marine sediment metagenome]
KRINNLLEKYELPLDEEEFLRKWNPLDIQKN